MQACSGSLERAADWLFSHMDDLDGAVAQVRSHPARPALCTALCAALCTASQCLRVCRQRCHSCSQTFSIALFGAYTCASWWKRHTNWQTRESCFFARQVMSAGAGPAAAPAAGGATGALDEQLQAGREEGVLMCCFICLHVSVKGSA